MRRPAQPLPPAFLPVSVGMQWPVGSVPADSRVRSPDVERTDGRDRMPAPRCARQMRRAALPGCRQVHVGVGTSAARAVSAGRRQAPHAPTGVQAGWMSRCIPLAWTIAAGCSGIVRRLPPHVPLVDGGSGRGVMRLPRMPVHTSRHRTRAAIGGPGCSDWRNEGGACVRDHGLPQRRAHATTPSRRVLPAFLDRVAHVIAIFRTG